MFYFLKNLTYTQNALFFSHNICKLIVGLLLVSYAQEVIELLEKVINDISEYFTIYAAESDTPNPSNKGTEYKIPIVFVAGIGGVTVFKAIADMGGKIFAGMNPNVVSGRYRAFGTVGTRGLIVSTLMFKTIYTSSKTNTISVKLQDLGIKMPSITASTPNGYSVTVDPSNTLPSNTATPSAPTSIGQPVPDVTLPGGFNKSSVVPTEVIDWIFAHIVPQWASDAYALRVPHALENLDGFSFMFAKYNIIVFLMNISMYLICFSLMVIIVVYFLPRVQRWTEQLYLVKYYFRFLLFNRNFIIKLNCCFILLNTITIFAGISFMFSNYFPEELGVFVDTNNLVKK